MLRVLFDFVESTSLPGFRLKLVRTAGYYFFDEPVTESSNASTLWGTAA